MRKKFKRGLAFLLTVMLIFTSTIFTSGTESKAAEEAEITQGEPVEELRSEEVSGQDEETIEDTIPLKPAKSNSQTVDGIIVTVDAPEGVLEDGWSLSVQNVSENQVESAVVSALGGMKEIAQMKAFDITILDKDGNEIQPDGAVHMSFGNVDIQGEGLEVYHLEDEAAEQVGQTESGDAVEVEAEHFSIYALVGIQEKTAANAKVINEKYRLTFDLNGGSGTLPEEIEAAPGEIVTLPEDTGFTNGDNLFGGWSESQNASDAGNDKPEKEGTVYRPGLSDFVMPSQNVTLYASWAETVVEAYKGEYDGQLHSVTVSGNFNEDAVEYSTDQRTWDKTPVAYKDVLRESGEAGEYPVYVRISDEKGAQVIASYIKITPKEVELTSASGQKEYDGDPLKKDVPSEDISMTEGKEFVEGEGASYIISGEQTDVGESSNTFNYTLNSNTLEENYQIKTIFGTLKVMKNSKEIIIKARIDDKKYDGTYLTNERYDFTQGILAEGDSLDVEIDGGIKDYGTVSNRVVGYKVIRSSDHKDVTNYYTFGTPVNGTLSITKRTVVLTSGSAGKTYDGNPLTSEVVEETGDGFISGEGASYTVTGSQTLAGESKNEYTYSFKPNTSPENYDIIKKEGTLTVRPIEKEITITANSNHKMYDGSPLEDPGYTFTKDVLIDGDQLTAAVEGRITDAGTVDNVIRDYNVMRGNEDVTSCYKFGVPENGKLSVTKRTVYLKSDCATQIYDGKALTKGNVTVSGDGFISGEGASYTVTGSQTDCGESLNTFSYELNEGTKSGNYDIILEEGKLIVTPKPLTITAENASKAYDGTELTGSEYTNSELAEGDVIESVKITGSQLDPGSSKNVPSEAVINRNGQNVTKNYDIQYIEGELTVTENKNIIVITADSAGRVYDGTPLTAGGYTYTPDVLEEGDELTVTVEGSITDYGTTENRVTRYKVMRGEKNVTSNYTFADPVNGTLKIRKRKVTLISASDRKTYDGETLKNSEISVSGEGFADQEGAEYTVTGSQLDCGDSLNEYTYSWKDGTKADNYEITKKTGILTITPITEEILITAGNDNKIYDGKALSNDSYSYTDDILLKGDRLEVSTEGSIVDVGKCRNNVTGWKVMRGEKDITSNYTFADPVNGTLEIQKRNVTLTSASGVKIYDGKALTDSEVSVSGEGFAKGEGAVYEVTGSQTDKGESANTFRYELTDGTKSTNYEINTEEGLLKIIPKPLKITAQSAGKAYDGTALTSSEYTNSELAKGDAIESVILSGSQLDAGSSKNTASKAVIKCKGRDADVTGNYEICYEEGLLTITPKTQPIVITADSAGKVYDGTSLTAGGYTYTPDVLEEGDELTVTVEGSITDYGTTENQVTGHKVMRGEKDITSNYTFADPVNGTLEIQKRNVTLTSASGVKIYDGKALTDSEVSVSGEGFAKGEGAVYEVTGSQTETGRSANTFGYTFNSGTKAENYDVKKTEGTLEVTPIADEITITAASGSKVYDGMELSDAGYSYTENILPEGHEIQVAVYGSQTEAGSSVNTVTEYKVIRMSDGNDVTSCFQFAEPVDGILEVKPRDITITVNNAVKMYGKEDPVFDGNIEGLIHPEDLTVSYGRDLADLEKENVGADITILAAYEENPNYNVTVIPGKLAIVKSDENAITATGTVAVYDGGEYGLEDVSVLLENSTISYSADGENFSSIPPVFTEAGTYVIYVKAECDGYEDVIAETTIVINQRVLDIQAESASKVYDGTPLTAEMAAIVNGTALIKGHEISEITVKGSQTEVGTSKNTASSAVIKDGDRDVTENYAIRYIDGLLTVTAEESVPPVTPEKPSAPIQPSVPMQPSAPIQPSVPMQPSAPAAPSLPEAPSRQIPLALPETLDTQILLTIPVTEDTQIPSAAPTVHGTQTLPAAQAVPASQAHEEPKAAPEDKSVYVPAEETPLADVMIADYVSRSLCVGLILFALGTWGFRIRRRKNGRHNLK